MKESVCFYNENGQYLGITARDTVHKRGLWHKVFHCWIVDPARKTVLFQERSSKKKFFPGKLDISAAGHYRAYEGPKEGLREVEEELGVTLAFEDLHFLGVKIDVGCYADIVNREFADVFMAKLPEGAQLRPDEAEEVNGFVWVPIEQGMALFNGDIHSLALEGMERKDNGWVTKPIVFSTGKVVPRIDRYYLRVFMAAESFISGRKVLVI